MKSSAVLRCSGTSRKDVDPGGFLLFHAGKNTASHTDLQADTGETVLFHSGGQ